MSAPNCPNCGEPITRALDAPYGWWDWQDDHYVMRTARDAAGRRLTPG